MMKLSIPGKYKQNKGFTLVEMLIVVAIIAVLVVVAIPIYSAQLEKTREQVCLNNRDTLRRLLYTEMLLDEVDQAGFQALVTRHISSSEIVCPSGGVISAELTELGTATVFCDKHYPGSGGAYGMGAGIPRFNLSDALLKAKAALTAGLPVNNAGQKVFPARIDSGAANGIYASQMRDFFANNNINPGGSDIKSWAMVRIYPNNTADEYYYYWTDTDISTLPEGSQVRVMRYNELRETYTAGVMTVGSTTNNGETYNIISGNFTQFSGQDDDTKKDFTQTLEFYNANPLTP